MQMEKLNPCYLRKVKSYFCVIGVLLQTQRQYQTMESVTKEVFSDVQRSDPGQFLKKIQP